MNKKLIAATIAILMATAPAANAFTNVGDNIFSWPDMKIEKKEPTKKQSFPLDTNLKVFIGDKKKAESPKKK